MPQDPKFRPVPAIKRYFEKADKIAPDGGREVTVAEVKALTSGERTYLGQLALVELGDGA